MTPKEKAELYDKVLERAKTIYKCDSLYNVKNALESIFSELKESENEKIRRCIGMCLTDVDEQRFDDYNTTLKDCLDWLEKQGEQKSVWSEEDERLCQCLIRDQEEALDDVRNDKYGHSEIISDLKETYRERIDWLESLKERLKGE